MDDTTARQTTGWTGLLDRPWHTLAGSRLTVVLLVWVAVVLSLSAVVPQAPPHIEDPLVRSQWLANVPANARPVVERLQVFGVFNLLDSAWLRLPLALLLAHAMVMLAHLSPAIWRRMGWSSRRPPGDSTADSPVDLPGKSLRLDRAWPGPVEHVGRQVINRLEKAGYRVLLRQDREGFVAWRWRWGWLGLAGVYLGLGLASAGLILTGWLGQVREIILEPGNPAPLSAPDAPSLVLDEVTGVGRDPIHPTTGLASMRLLTGVGESRRLVFPLHHSRLLRGTWLTLVDLRPVAEVTAVDTKTGEHALLRPFAARTSSQERVRLPLAEDPEARFVGIPAQNVTLRVDYQPDAERPATPAFSLSLFQGSETLPSQSALLVSGDEVTLGEMRYLVVFDYDAILRGHSTLWWVMVAVGWGVTALSFSLLAVITPVYVRGQVTAEGEAKAKGCRVTLTVEALGDEQRLRRLRQELRACLENRA